MSAVACPHCGQPMLQVGASATPTQRLAEPPHRYDLELLAARALAEKAYDETARARVSQEDIRKLVKKRSRPTP